MEFLWVKTSLLDFNFTLGVVVIIPGNMFSTRPSPKKLKWVQTIPMTCPVGSSMPEAARPAHSDPSWFGRGGDRSKVERKMYWIVLIQFVCCSVMWCHVVCIETLYILNTYLRSICHNTPGSSELHCYEKNQRNHLFAPPTHVEHSEKRVPRMNIKYIQGK